MQALCRQRGVELLEGHLMPLKKGKGTGTSKAFGLITRGVIKGFTLEVLKEKEPLWVVHAEDVEIDFRKKQTRMTKVLVQNMKAGDRIQSDAAVWDDRGTYLKIPGVYRMSAGNGVTGGKGIKIAMDFAISPL